MGFCYSNNGLCCDFCDRDYIQAQQKSIKKYRCPFGYCQAYALCNSCKVKNTRESHIKAGCKEGNEKYEKREAQKNELLNKGLYLLWSCAWKGSVLFAFFRNKNGDVFKRGMTEIEYNLFREADRKEPIGVLPEHIMEAIL